MRELRNFEHKEKKLRSDLQNPGPNLYQLFKGKNSWGKKGEKKKPGPLFLHTLGPLSISN